MPRARRSDPPPPPKSPPRPGVLTFHTDGTTPIGDLVRAAAPLVLGGPAVAYAIDAANRAEEKRVRDEVRAWAKGEKATP